MEEFFITWPSSDPKFCGVAARDPVLNQKGWRITRGLPMGDRYPEGVRFQMSSLFPGLVVPDLIQNTLRYTLISPALRGLLEEHSGVEIEFLPFTLLNHKGRPDAECYIANVLETRDAGDMERTEAVESLVRTGEYQILKRLFLREDVLPDLPELFRLKQLPHVLVARRGLMERMKSEKITGVEFIPMGQECSVE